MRLNRLTGIGVLLVAGVFISAGDGQEKKPLPPKAGSKIAPPSDALIYNSLRQVINTGADLFNVNTDYLGCYRVFQGGLIAVKPLLKPELQADIESALAEAEKMTTFAEKANRLRAIIDVVREQTKPSANNIPLPPVLKKSASSPTNADGELIRAYPNRSKN